MTCYSNNSNIPFKFASTRPADQEAHGQPVVDSNQPGIFILNAAGDILAHIRDPDTYFKRTMIRTYGSTYPTSSPSPKISEAERARTEILNILNEVTPQTGRHVILTGQEILSKLRARMSQGQNREFHPRTPIVALAKLRKDGVIGFQHKGPRKILHWKKPARARGYPLKPSRKEEFIKDFLARAKDFDALMFTDATDSSLPTKAVSMEGVIEPEEETTTMPIDDDVIPLE